MQNRTCSSYAERSRKCQRNLHESFSMEKMATCSVALISLIQWVVLFVCPVAYCHFFEIFGCTRQYEQALLRSLARKFALRFSAALGNMSKLHCARLHENSRHIVLACLSEDFVPGYRFHELFIVLEVFCCPRISLIYTNHFQWEKWRPVRSH